MNTAARLKELRLLKGLSQQQVADFLDIDRSSYNKYEAGISKPTRKLQELSELFNVSIDYLLCKDELPNSLDNPFFEKYKKYQQIIDLLDKLPPDAQQSIASVVEQMVKLRSH